MELPSHLFPLWNVQTELSREQFQTFQAAGIEALHAQLLHNRGILTPEAMLSYIAANYTDIPDPQGLIDMDRAVERIRQALEGKEHITIYGDYDADGVTSSALLMRALRTLNASNAPLDFYIPSRISEGCGLNLNALHLLKERGTSLIITTDCGSSDVEQVKEAQKLGIDVIITDHHQPPAILPDAYAMINPWRKECTYGECYLCGVGVAFKLAQALYRAAGRSLEDEMALLDLVAIGTIADIVPLLGENHTLVRLGLQRLNQTQKPGLVALIQKANLVAGNIRERDIAYGLSPRINAAGRMKDAGIAFKLLTTDDPAEAAQYVEQLEELNQQRQQQTEELMQTVRQEARYHPNDQVILVSGKDWPEGIIGLVAGKLSEELHRPVLVLSKGSEFSRASARGPKGFNIIAALRARAEIFVRYGGHAQAAGFTIANERIDALHEHLLAWSDQDEPNSATVTIDDTIEVPEPEQETLFRNTAQMIDIVFTRLEKLNYSTYKKIRELGPFGAANPEPVFLMNGLTVLSSRISGMEGRNLRLLLGDGTSKRWGTLVRGKERLSEFPVGQKVSIVFRLEGSWNANGTDGKQDTWLKLLEVEAV